MKKIFCLPVLIFFVLSAQAGAPKFVDPAQIHAEQILPTPATPGSIVSQNELAVLHQIQANRSKTQISKAQSDTSFKSIFLYQNVLGERFNAEHLPITAKFFKRIKKDVHLNTEPAKILFHRKRPYNLDKTLSPVCKTHSADDSYPSEHSTLGYVYALVLIEMVPEKRDAILMRADEYAHNRLLCGSHFPSDVAAGKSLAYAIHAVMDTKPNFQQELAKARAELRPALGLFVLP